MQFGRASPRILPTVWEAEPVQGPIWVSKLDAIDTYHHGTVKLAQVDAFAYVIPLALGDEGKIICIELVLPIGGSTSPSFSACFQKL